MLNVPLNAAVPTFVTAMVADPAPGVMADTDALPAVLLRSWAVAWTVDVAAITLFVRVMVNAAPTAVVFASDVIMPPVLEIVTASDDAVPVLPIIWAANPAA